MDIPQGLLGLRRLMGLPQNHLGLRRLMGLHGDVLGLARDLLSFQFGLNLDLQTLYLLGLDLEIIRLEFELLQL